MKVLQDSYIRFPNRFAAARSILLVVTVAAVTGACWGKKPVQKLEHFVPEGDYLLFADLHAAAGEAVPERRIIICEFAGGESVFVRLRGQDMTLEEKASGPAVTLGRAQLAPSAAGEAQKLVIRVVGGEVSVYGQTTAGPNPQSEIRNPQSGRRRLLGPVRAASLSASGSARAGFWTADAAAGAIRTALQPLNGIRFRDDFMRAAPSGAWRVVTGEWLLSGSYYAERSANPFSLVAKFGRIRLEDLDVMNRGRPEPEREGYGFLVSTWRGPPSVERITGDGAGARAGVAESDIIAAIDGEDTLEATFSHVAKLLNSPGPHVVTVLRAGASKEMSFTVRKGNFKWGTAKSFRKLPGATESSRALLVTGKRWWDAYRFQAAVRPVSSEGFGLAFAYRKDNGTERCLLFRAQGEWLELVRVDGAAEEVLERRRWRPFPQTTYRFAVELNSHSIRCLVDEHAVFEHETKLLPAGKVGVWSASSTAGEKTGGAVYFDDVSVVNVSAPSDTTLRSSASILRSRATAEDGSLRSTRVPGKRGSRAGPKPSGHEVLYREHDMREWANPAAEWLPEAETEFYVNMFSFPGESRVDFFRPKFEKLECVLGARKAWEDSSRRLDVSDAVRAVVDRASATVTVVWPGGTEETRALEWGEEESIEHLAVEVCRGGVKVSANDGNEVLFPLASGSVEAAPTRTVAFRGLRNAEEPGAVSARGDHVFSYDFKNAPCDWLVTSGSWGVANKWVCDPRWCWWAGKSEKAACTWTKTRFEGDVRLDFHFALMMQKNDPPYERVGDYCATICGDGRDPMSGYALIISGGGNRWTRLYRQGKMVAETREADFLCPSAEERYQPKPLLHQRWFQVTLEKRGNKVLYGMDLEPGIVFEDPEPLAGGRIALWTVNNGMLLARVRIACERARVCPLESRDDFAAGPSAEVLSEVFSVSAGGEARRRAKKPRQDEKEGIRFGVMLAGRPFAGTASFERCRFRPQNMPMPRSPKPPMLAIDTSHAAGGKRSLLVTSTTDGSRMGLNLARTPVNLATYPILDFDLLMPRTAPFNLIFDHRKQEYAVVITDEAEPQFLWSWRTKFLGDVGEVPESNEWRHISVNLLERMLSERHDEAVYVVRNVHFGDEGWRGTHAGVRYWLDNVRIVPAIAGNSVEFRWRASKQEVVDFRSDFDRSPDTEPSDKIVFKRRVDRLDAAADKEPHLPPCGPGDDGIIAGRRVVDPAALPDGPAYFHLKLKDASGRWSETEHFKLILDNSPPKVAELHPPPGSRSSSTTIRVSLEERSVVNIYLLRLYVAGRMCTVPASPELTLHQGRRELVWRPVQGTAPEWFKDGTIVEASLQGLADHLGNRSTEVVKWSWTVDSESDLTPPPPPQLSYTTVWHESYRKPGEAAKLSHRPEVSGQNDFEVALEQVRPVHGCRLELVRRADAPGVWGKTCLRISPTRRRAGRFMTVMNANYVRLDRTPYVMFDCLAPPSAELSLSLDVLGHEVIVPFSVQGDGEWHKVLLDLGGASAEARAKVPVPFCGEVRLVGKVKPGAGVFLDNIEFIERDWKGFRFEWTEPEGESGIRGYAYAFAPAAGQEPGIPDELMLDRSRRHYSPPAAQMHGRRVFLVRAVDWAGKWSKPARVTVEFPEKRPE